jgi:enterochelin esterase-like enzyme
LAALVFAGCNGSPPGSSDAGAKETDAPSMVPTDAGAFDGQVTDAGNADAMPPDAQLEAQPDAQPIDGGPIDVGGSPCAFGGSNPTPTLDPRVSISPSRLVDLERCAAADPAHASTFVDGLLEELLLSGGGLPWSAEGAEVLFRGDATALTVSGSFDAWPSPGTRTFRTIPNTDLSVAEIPVGTAERVQYKLTRTTTAGVVWSGDAINPWVRWDGIDHQAPGEFNAEAVGPSHAPTSSFLYRSFIVDRDVFLQLPTAVFTSSAPPPLGVLYVHDGNEMLTRAGLEDVVDTAIGSGQAAPLAIAYIALPDQSIRTDEYTFGTPTALGDQYLQMIIDRIAPEIESHVRTSSMPAHRGLAGASLGGLISFYGGWTHNEFFRRVGAQSPSFFWNNDDLIHRVQAGPMRDLTVYLDCGSPNDNTDVTQMMADALAAANYPHTLVVQAGGQHDWSYWAQRFPGLLAYLY